VLALRRAILHPQRGHLLLDDHPRLRADGRFHRAPGGPVTGGDNGLPGIPGRRWALQFDNPLHLYYFTLALAALGYLIAARATESPFGQALRAIRDNRSARRASATTRACRCSSPS